MTSMALLASKVREGTEISKNTLTRPHTFCTKKKWLVNLLFLKKRGKFALDDAHKRTGLPSTF